jgi:hypothetical protein
VAYRADRRRNPALIPSRRSFASTAPRAWASAALNSFDGYGGEIDLDSRKKGLQGEITAEDTGTFTMPWSGKVTYQPGKGQWSEVICAENLTKPAGLQKNASIADKPDF